MRENDITSIVQIERASFSAPWSAEAFRQEIHKPYASSLIAIAQDRVIGYLCVNIILDECHILNLAVHADFRRQGIASALMRKILAESTEQGCGVFYLEVRSSNTAARKFYEHLGFRTAGVRRNYYNYPVEDAAVMALMI